MKTWMILAVGENGELGKDNCLLWKKQKDDMTLFKEMTLGKAALGPSYNNSNAVIMGRKTWDSIPDKFKPLEGRLNIVVSSTQTYSLPVLTATSVEEALDMAEANGCEEAFLAGGKSIYLEGLALVDRVMLTIIHQSFPDADVRMPEALDLLNFGFIQASCESNCFADDNNEYPYTFVSFKRDNSWIRVDKYFERDTKLYSEWDWKSEYEKLLAHHRKETQFLLRYIQRRNVNDTLIRQAKEIAIFKIHEEMMYEEVKTLATRDQQVKELVKEIVSSEMFDAVQLWLNDKENGIWGNLQIVSTPVGKYQEEESYKPITGMWVDQSCGMSGDDYSGTITIKISEDKYLQANFSL